MKVLAVLLLCAFAAVQGRSAISHKNTRAVAVLGENPYVVHLRVAASNTGGQLNTCGGSLIDPRWVLTSSDCTASSSFIWIRYGLVNVINPGLVTETSTVRRNDIIALISVNRFVQTTDNIAPIALGGSSKALGIGTVCGFGENDNNGPGETLSCISVTLDSEEDGIITATSDEGLASTFDRGAALVQDGVQIGILAKAGDDSSAGSFAALDQYLEWIALETGLEVNRGGVEPKPEADYFGVKVVN